MLNASRGTDQAHCGSPVGVLTHSCCIAWLVEICQLAMLAWPVHTASLSAWMLLGAANVGLAADHCLMQSGQALLLIGAKGC
jgi:hypothetical protein